MVCCLCAEPCTARVAVHFQYIVEKFTPHDTIFSFVAFSELKDSKLSSACSLHTASASIKSSSDSLRPPALSEIAEDAHESPASTVGDHDTKRPRSRSTGSERVRSRTASFREATDRHQSSKAQSMKETPSPPRSTRTIRNTNKALPLTPPELNHVRKRSNSNYDENSYELRQSFDAHSSFQSGRPPTGDLPGPYDYKPKIKLGPRPSIDSPGRMLNSDSPRPISTLPASVRVPTRKTIPVRPKSQHSQKSRNDMSSPKTILSPPLPILPIDLPYLPTDPKMNVMGSPARVTQPKSPAITPEKRRLMKALQLRQKQMAAMSSKKEAALESSTQPVSQEEEPVSKATVHGSNTDDETHRIVKTNTHDDRDSEQASHEDANQNHPTNIESSPISIPDASECSSTQASSVTEEEDSRLLEKIIARSNSVLSFTESQNALKNDPSHDSSMDNILPEKDGEVASESPFNIVNIDLRKSAPLTSQRSMPNLAVIDEKPTLPQEVPLPPVDDDEESDLNDGGSNSVESKRRTRRSTEFRRSLDSDITDRPQGHTEDSSMSRPSTSDTFGDPAVDKVSRRHGLALSIRASSPENSDDHFLSDDSFMEELGSATVQEAKPVSVSVSKSPITPVFPRFPGENKSAEAQVYRTVSYPLDEGTKDDLLNIPPNVRPYLSTRSYSASHSANTQSQQASAMMLKKVGVSSGISQRIKALEKLSSRPTSPSSQGGSNSSSAVTSPTFVTLRKASLKTPPAPSELTSSAFGRSRQKLSSLSPSPNSDADSIGHKDRFINVKMESNSKKSRPESISVTATIIRDSGNKMPKVPVNPSEPRVLDLHQSPLMVEHQSTGMAPPSSPRKQSKSRLNSTHSLSSSSIERKSEPSQASRRDSFASRRSFTSGRGSEVDLPRSISDTSINGFHGNDGIREEKKESRKSRLFKRMSGISSASRRSIVHVLNPTVKEEPIVEHHETVYEPPSSIADFGDVNIQFPDTLVGPPLSVAGKC